MTRPALHADWAVVRLSVVDPASRLEVSLLAERTEGDAMRLRAPVAWQGDEEGGAAALGAGCAAGAALRFDCDRLLADAAADALLRGALPSLCGRGALVTGGRLELEVPAGALPSGWGRGGGGVGGGGGEGGGGAPRVTGQAVLDSPELWE